MDLVVGTLVAIGIVLVVGGVRFDRAFPVDAARKLSVRFAIVGGVISFSAAVGLARLYLGGS